MSHLEHFEKHPFDEPAALVFMERAVEAVAKGEDVNRHDCQYSTSGTSGMNIECECQGLNLTLCWTLIKMFFSIKTWK